MKRTFLSCCILLCTLCSVCAQEQPLISPDDSIRSLLGRIFPNTNPNLSAHMNLEFYTSGAAYFTDGNLDEAAFKLNRVRLQRTFLIIFVSLLINTVIRTRWIICPLLSNMRI